MASRTKRTQKGAESLIREIELHFKKLEKDILEGNVERGRYHIKEIDRSLLKALEIKIQFLKEDMMIVNDYRKRLERLIKELNNQ